MVWWRTLHQPPTVLSPDAGLPIDGRMALALLVHLVAFTLLAAVVGSRRLRTLDRVRPLRAPAASDRLLPVVTVRRAGRA